MRYILLIFVFLPTLAYGQLQISYAPQSIAGWGTTPGTSVVSLQYGYVGILHMTTDASRVADLQGNPLEKSVTGVFVEPLQFEWSAFNIGAGLVYLDKKAPTETGTRFNFRLSAGVHYDTSRLRLGLSYVHISNCWTGTINPGWDLPSLSIEMKL